MRIKDMVACIVSVLLIIGGIFMYRVVTSTQILETPVIIGTIYIWGYRILIPVGTIGFIVSAFNIRKNYLVEKEENEKQETNSDNIDKTKELLK